MAIKANKRQNRENKQIALDLNWNLHLGLYGFLTSPFPIDRNYFFFLKHFGAQGSSYSFDGKYHNYDFILAPIVIPQGEYSRLNYLAVEFTNLSLKKYDLVILSQAENDWAYEQLSMGEFKRVKLESDEFNKEFAVYALHAEDIFYALPPDRMFNLLAAKDISMISKLYIQVKNNSILVVGDYRPYIEYVKGLNSISKKEILTGFMDTAFAITNSIAIMV